MILKALYDYYHRCGDLPKFGTELQAIAFIIVIDKEGNFVRIEDKRSKENKKGVEYLVTKHKTRTSAPKPNHLWDNGKYVLGIDDKGLNSYNTFVDDINRTCKENPDDQSLKALAKFYSTPYEQIISVIEKDPLWKEIKSMAKLNFALQIEGDTIIIAERDDLIEAETDKNAKTGTCLITGSKGDIVRLSTATFIPGAQAVASLVNMNKGFGYDSYGKLQCYNAPISVDAEFCYSTALKHLLRKDSRNKFYLGSRTFVFWASKNDEAGREAEDSIFNLFGFSDVAEDDPNAKIEKVREVFKGIYSGEIKTTLEDKFYILGLAPNSARIAVVYWNECELSDFAKKILKHFDDMEIVDTRKERRPYYGLRTMMSAITLNGKAQDVQPNLPEAVMKSMLQDTPYPYPLFNQCINRIRAEQGEKQSVTIARAAIIKAYLNRQQNNNNKKIEIMLDKENINQGYLCGRLFAVLERIQYKAQKNVTIRSRYMNAASATPAAVFPTLLNLSLHHFEKLYGEVKEELEQWEIEILSN